MFFFSDISKNRGQQQAQQRQRHHKQAENNKQQEHNTVKQGTGCSRQGRSKQKQACKQARAKEEATSNGQGKE